jgi:hypothetical protein
LLKAVKLENNRKAKLGVTVNSYSANVTEDVLPCSVAGAGETACSPVLEYRTCLLLGILATIQSRTFHIFVCCAKT